VAIGNQEGAAAADRKGRENTGEKYAAGDPETKSEAKIRQADAGRAKAPTESNGKKSI